MATEDRTAGLAPLTDVLGRGDVIACSCGSTAFFDWCVQIVARRDYGRAAPRARDFVQSDNVRICVNCHLPIVVLDGTAYDASMFVSCEQIGALIELGRARRHATPVRAMDP